MTPLERSEDAIASIPELVKASVVVEFPFLQLPEELAGVATAEATARWTPYPAGLAKLVLLMAPDPDQLRAELNKHRACSLPCCSTDGAWVCRCGHRLPNPTTDPNWDRASTDHLVDVFIAYLQQGIKPSDVVDLALAAQDQGPVAA